MCDAEGCSTVLGGCRGGGPPPPAKRGGAPPPFVDPNPTERGTESEVAQKWARWLHNRCCLVDPHCFRAGGRIRGGPQVDKVAGYTTPAAWGIPTASERGTESEVLPKWASWLHNPCRLVDPHRFRAGGRIRGGPQVGKVATQPLPPRGSPSLQSRGQNQRWSPSGQAGYITPAAWWIPTASEQGAESEVAPKWARWLHNPCRLGDPHRFRAGDKIRGGPQVGKLAT